MAEYFPSNPIPGESYSTPDGSIWTWDGFSWTASGFGGTGTGGISNVKVSSGTTTISANGLNFINTASVLVSVGAGTTGNANVSFSAVSGTTAVAGIVQLTTSVISTSTTTAATPTSVKSAFDQATLGYDQANAAYAAANTGLNKSQVSANSGSIQSNVGINFNNTSTTVVSVGPGSTGNANISFSVIPKFTTEINTTSNLSVTGTGTFRGGVNSGYEAKPTYKFNIDFGADVGGTWRRFIVASLVDIQYSTIGFKITITDPNTNHASTGSVDADFETYMVACVRTNDVTANTPDSCIVRGAGNRIRGVKTAIGSYEIQIQNEAQYREYLVQVECYAVNGGHAIAYESGATVGASDANTSNVFLASIGASTNYFERVEAKSRVVVTADSATGNTDTLITPATIALRANVTNGSPNATINMYASPTLGYSVLEMGASLGNYIDFKSPSSDDFDYRIFSDGAGGAGGGLIIYAGSSTASLNVLNIIGGNVSIDSGTLFVDYLANEVGIGTTLPTAKLHVVGNALLTNEITANGVIGSDPVGTTSTRKIIQAVNGNHDIGLIPRAAVGAYNPSVQVNDAVIVSSNTTSGVSGNTVLNIIPWSDVASGIRIATNDNKTNITLTAITTTFSSNSVFPAGKTVSFNNTTGTAPFTVVSTTVVPNLNADLLDGYQLTQLVSVSPLTSANTTAFANGAFIGLNAYYDAGWKAKTTQDGAYTIRNSGNTVGLHFLVQDGPVTAGGAVTFNNYYFRDGDIFSESNKVWHAGNDGSGSGLDADTLDSYNVGSSGTTIPLLSGTNTWGATQNFSVSPVMKATTSSEGGELILEKPTASTLAASVHVDLHTDTFRVFENGGGFRGMQIALTSLPSGIHTIWTSGNDGSGSGLDADLLDGISSGSFLRSDIGDSWSGSASGPLYIEVPLSAQGNTTGQANTLVVYQANTTANDAFMTFHLAGRHAAHFGLDAQTNDLFYGGWSAGAFKYKILHENNVSELRVSLVPSITAQYDLGSGTYYWRDVYSVQFASTPVSSIAKYRLYGDSDLYAIGMVSGHTFGPLSGDGWAMTFRFSDTSNRGFWWGDSSHTTAQGAMALSTDGNLYVANNVSLGYGESYTTDASSWEPRLDVRTVNLGSVAADNVVAAAFTTAPGNASKLEVCFVRKAAGSDWTTIGTRLQARTDVTYQGYIDFNGDNNYGISFGAGSSTSSANAIPERMRIDSTGNIGIGITSPTAKLHVVGGSGTIVANIASTFPLSGGLTPVVSIGNIDSLRVSGETILFQKTRINNITPASFTYSGKFFRVNTEESTPTGFTFKPDGTKMYVTGQAGDDVNEYDLTTPWDASTATYLQKTVTLTQDTTPADVAFSSNGEYVYTCGSTTGNVYQYYLSVPWSTISLTSATGNLVATYNVAAQDISAAVLSRGITFSDDGVYLYVSNATAGGVVPKILQFQLASPWNIASATYIANSGIGVLSSTGSVSFVSDGMTFNNDGSLLQIADTTNKGVNFYYLKTPWMIANGISFFSNVAIPDGSTTVRAGILSPDGRYLNLLETTNRNVYTFTTNTISSFGVIGDSNLYGDVSVYNKLTAGSANITGKIVVSSIFDTAGANLAAGVTVYANSGSVQHTKSLNFVNTSSIIVSVDSGSTGNSNISFSYKANGLYTIWVPSTSMFTRSTNGANAVWTESATNKINMRTFDFSNTTQQYVQFSIRMPKAWDRGTIQYEPSWTAFSGAGYSVSWNVAAVAFSDGDWLDGTAMGTPRTSTDTLTNVNYLHVGPQPATPITVAGTPQAGDVLWFEVSRDVGGTTIAANTKLIGVTLFINVNAKDDT